MTSQAILPPSSGFLPLLHAKKTQLAEIDESMYDLRMNINLNPKYQSTYSMCQTRIATKEIQNKFGLFSTFYDNLLFFEIIM